MNDKARRMISLFEWYQFIPRPADRRSAFLGSGMYHPDQRVEDDGGEVFVARGTDTFLYIGIEFNAL